MLRLLSESGICSKSLSVYISGRHRRGSMRAEVDDEMHDVEMHTPAGAQISAPSVAGQAGARHMGSYRPDAENLPPPVSI